MAQRLANASLRPASISKVVAAIRWGARTSSKVAFDGTFAGPEWSAAVRRLVGGAVRSHPSMAAPTRLATPLSFLVAQPLLQRLHTAVREGRSLRIPLSRRQTPSRRAGAAAPAAFAHLTSDAADVLWGLVVLGKALFLRKKEAADLRMADVQTMRRQDVALLRVTFPTSKMQGRRTAAAGPAADFTDPVSGAEFTICGPHMSAHGNPVEWVLRRQGQDRTSAGRGAAQPVFPAIVRVPTSCVGGHGKGGLGIRFIVTRLGRPSQQGGTAAVDAVPPFKLLESIRLRTSELISCGCLARGVSVHWDGGMGQRFGSFGSLR